MPSTHMLNVQLQSLPCFENEGMVWIWPGDSPPLETLPSLQPPPGFTIHAEVKQCVIHHTKWPNNKILSRSFTNRVVKQIP